MTVYDYSNLLKAVRDAKTDKAIAENKRTVRKKNILVKLETELKSSGLLDDWYDLKRLCRETEVRIMPYGGWDEVKQGLLMADCEYFCDNGMFAQSMASGSHFCDMFGFSYKDRCFKWKTIHDTNSIFFNSFENEDVEIDIKIKLIQLFMKRYEEYRAIQLQRVYTKLGKTIEETVKICSEVTYCNKDF